VNAQASKAKAVDLLHQLHHAQVLQRSQYERALSLVHATNERAEDVLIDNDILSETDLLKALSGIYRTHFVSAEKLAKADIPRATVQMIPRRVAETLGVFPVLFDQQTSVLSIVTPDPENVELLREVKLVSGARDVKAFVARPAAVAAAIRKHHAGDPRAFERFERVVPYEFGQQVLADGRVMTARDTFRRNATRDEETLDRISPAPTPKRSHPDLDGETDFTRPQRQSAPELVRARQSAPDLDMPPPPPPPPLPHRSGRTAPVVMDEPRAAPPPLPPEARTKAPSVKRIPADRSLPAPPPPLPAREQPMPQPQRARTRASVDLPPPQEPSALTNRVLAPAPVSERPQNPFQNDMTIELLTVMVSLLENARQELRGHSSQVARLLRRVAERMNLEKADVYSVIIAGHIHDIGKMGQFHLTAFNCSEYEGHRLAAQKAFDTPLRLLEAVRLPPSIKNAVFHLYERFDGKGFPHKLSGKEIPLGARLLAIADTYADLTQNPRNPFRKVLMPNEAMEVLMKHKGTIFDPAILDLFKTLVLGEDMKAKLLANRHGALIIDPDPEESTVLELRMVEQGFDVKIARSADAARRLLSMEGAEFDLVVSEVDLPDADGLAFLSEAKKETWGRDLAWIVYTHKQGRTEAQRAFENGALDFVAKPVQADVLVAKIKAMLEQHAQSGKGGGAKGVSGSLREMGLPDIVQVLFHGRKTGKLTIKSGGKTGEIHFLEGAIANAILGSLQGADAFYAMVRFSDGEFALDPTFVPPKRVVAESAEALLLEGMRRMDEGI
jgi:response regulator RpfG family c-di-GMP phosphodiesterase